ncbi:DUF6891 domain-containing protein [Moraxella porci]|uniref:DUF6891 domain-containing protein n=1 Tax=Moraxella porci TaxID=1288392 RepID=UPI00244761B8|nr:hypothetical protein [Moraxella porci]MDH2273107.1 hypothetical protein [Moraxella porci]
MFDFINLDIERQLEIMTQLGIHSQARLYTIYHEELYAPDELDSVWLQQTINQLYAKHEAHKQTWEYETDNDKLTKAFAELNSEGIISLEHAGFTNSDGYEDVMSVYSKAKNPSLFYGYAFYHEQDAISAVMNGTLMLSFGSLDSEKEQTLGIEVGQKIVNTLNRYGLQTSWNGTFEQKIQIDNFKWQKR